MHIHILYMHASICACRVFGCVCINVCTQTGTQSATSSSWRATSSAWQTPASRRARSISQSATAWWISALTSTQWSRRFTGQRPHACFTACMYVRICAGSREFRRGLQACIYNIYVCACAYVCEVSLYTRAYPNSIEPLLRKHIHGYVCVKTCIHAHEYAWWCMYIYMHSCT